MVASKTLKRSYHSAVVCGHKMIVFGGITNSNLVTRTAADLWEFDLG